MTAFSITSIASLAEVSAAAWDALAGASGGNVFVRHAFLHALSESGCATAERGWTPCHLLAHDEQGALRAAMPLYRKAHSFGEYVFDWSWARAWQRAGGEYYPKLVSAVPFTPCTGPRVLAADAEASSALIAGALEFARRDAVSGLHVLFPTPEEAAAWQRAGLSLREGVQFHWTNAGQSTFADWLGSMSHDKRKRIRQDRRYVAEQGLRWRHARGAAITAADWAFFHVCYEATYHAHGATPYLNLEFFRAFGARCGDAALLFIGEREGEPLCASLCALSGDTLYGRYWGTRVPLRSLHFEACYYQPIDWCIGHGVRRFEGGAQGVHKLARGLLPNATVSAHWLADDRFDAAVREALAHERRDVEEAIEELTEHSPFKLAPTSASMDEENG